MSLRLIATLLLSLVAGSWLGARTQSPDPGPMGPSPYDVVRGWHQPFSEPGFAFGGNSGVFAESADRIFIAQRGEFRLPTPIPPGYAGFAGSIGLNVLLAPDAAARRVWKNCLYTLDRNGRVKERWTQWDSLCEGSSGPGPHRVRISPYDPERRVWVINETFHQIYVFSNDGKRLLKTLGEKNVAGSDGTHFGRPQDVAFLPDGRILVADGLDNHRVMILDRDGNYLSEFGGPGKGPGQFNGVHAVAVGPDGRIFALDRSGGRINVFRTTADPKRVEFVDAFGGFSLPLDLIVNDESVWMTDLKPLRFVKLDFSGKRLYTWMVPSDLPDGYLEVHTFSVDPEGNLYGGDNQYGRTQKFVPRKDADKSLLIRPPWVAPRSQSGSNDPLARDILKELIEIDTTDTPAGNITAAAEAMAARLRAGGFPAADVQVLGPHPRKHNLVARYRGTGAKRPILLLAHLDVVTARREDWTTDPFTFVEKDGYYYGRGTTDDKAMAAQFVANLVRLKKEGFAPDRDLILALTADEETGDFNGVDWLVTNHRPLIDAEFAINEGGGGRMRKGRYLTNEVQASEKVYQDFRLEVKNAGGHSSLPVKDNAIYHLSAALARLAAFEFPIALNEVTRSYFERSSRVEPDPQVAADMRAVAAATPDAAAAARLAAAQPYFNAQMRTTCVATLLEGGHATNALPQMARANVNCRILPGVAPPSVRDTLVKVLADPAITVTAVGEARPSRPSPLRPDVMETVESLTKAMYPGVLVVPVMSTGATDALYLRNGEIPTYGISGTFGDMDDVRAHGRDERIGIKQFFEGLEFQYRLIKALAGR